MLRGDATARLKNGPCKMMPRIHDPRGSAQPVEGSTFALLAPMLAAPSGPSAMCFLRPARGFGWLDPRLNDSAIASSRSHHPVRRHRIDILTPLRG
jgi:hypothetical protein